MSLTVLIVDDEENARFNIGSFLTARGYEVIGASTLAEAREALRRGNADIILLDVLLPDGSGADLLDETAHMPNRPPIIMITAFGDIEMAVNAMKSGAHDFYLNRSSSISWKNPSSAPGRSFICIASWTTCAPYSTARRISSLGAQRRCAAL
jgi:DNA-binding NtrC family response regulator